MFTFISTVSFQMKNFIKVIRAIRFWVRGSPVSKASNSELGGPCSILKPAKINHA